MCTSSLPDRLMPHRQAVHRRRWIAAWIAVAFVLTSHAPRAARADESADAIAAAAEKKSAAELLPASTVVYAEVSRPGELVELLLDHPLRSKLEALDAYRAVVLSKQYLQFTFGLSIAETALGMKWDQAVKTLAGEGIYIGIDAHTQGGVVLVRSTDAKKLGEVRDKLLAFARAEAKKKGGGDPIQEIEHRGVKAFKLGDGYAATIGPWLMLTNKPETGKSVIDRVVDPKETSLGGKMEFLSAGNSINETTTGPKPVAWAYVDIATLRSAGLLAKVLTEKTDNPGLELLAGGILSNLGETPYATVALYVDNAQLRLIAAAPHAASLVTRPCSRGNSPNRLARNGRSG